MIIRAASEDGGVQFLDVFFREGAFWLTDKSGWEVEVECPLDLDAEFSDKQFSVFYFSKFNLKENSIYQVVDGLSNKRIGWLIPVAALSSNLHDFSNNPHFLRYAYKAIEGALHGVSDDIYTRRPNIVDGRGLLLSDIFHENTALLVISHETLVEGVVFDFLRAVPSFARYGYFPLRESDPTSIDLLVDEPDGDKLKIYLTSNDLSENKIIESLLLSLASSAKNPVMKFFYLYQIVELLIERIFALEQRRVAQYIAAAIDDSAKVKDAIERVQSNLAEKKRLSVLVERYSKVGSDLTDLRIVCNDLLVALGMEQHPGFESYFYSIRNFIFHQYRNFPDPHLSKLDRVSEEFLKILPSMLSRFVANQDD
ncbi:MAG TPA: hypothetical protein DF427_07615 [Moraxellaceae bacterium]|nr:hypothetical protein [Moraxellaceae bacterium]